MDTLLSGEKRLPRRSDPRFLGRISTGLPARNGVEGIFGNPGAESETKSDGIFRFRRKGRSSGCGDADSRRTGISVCEERPGTLQRILLALSGNPFFCSGNPDDRGGWKGDPSCRNPSDGTVGPPEGRTSSASDPLCGHRSRLRRGFRPRAFSRSAGEREYLPCRFQSLCRREKPV